MFDPNDAMKMRRKFVCESAERALPGRKMGSSPVSVARGELSVMSEPQRSTLGHVWLSKRRAATRHQTRTTSLPSTTHLLLATHALPFLRSVHIAGIRCMPNTRTTNVPVVAGATVAATSCCDEQSLGKAVTPASRRTSAKTPQAHQREMW